jgi:hypothetical protein
LTLSYQNKQLVKQAEEYRKPEVEKRHKQILDDAADNFINDKFYISEDN